MKYAYYPGCSLHSVAKDYDASVVAVCRRLGIELEEVKDWICCGSYTVHAVPRRLSMSLALYNLAQAEKQGLKEMMVPCTGCVSRFKFAQHEMKQSPQLGGEVEEIVEHRFENKVRVLHPLAVFSGDGLLDQLASLRGKLAGLKVVCYYGCLLTRPPQVANFDDPEYPQSMDWLLRALGASVLDWGYRTDCCGASFTLTRTDIVYKLSYEILNGAREAGAEAIAIACPLCHLNLDSRQPEIEKVYGTRFNLPIFYFTELMAIAMGVPSSELRLESHFVDGRQVLEKVGTS